MRITVTTPTGHIGSVLAERLLSSGHEVTLIAREPSKVSAFASRGARIVEGNQKDSSAIGRAIDKADALFWLSPSDYGSDNLRRHTNELTGALIAALRASPGLRVVTLSSIGAQLSTGTGPITGLYDMEQKLSSSSARVTHLRADSFMENVLSSIPTIVSDGAIYSAAPGTVATRQIATRDIAQAAAEILVDPKVDAKVINLRGPEEISFNRVAEVLSETLGSRIAHVQAPEDAIRAALVQAGLSQDVAAQLVELELAMASGRLRAEDQYPTRYGSTTFASLARDTVVPALLEAGYKPKQA